MLFKRKMYRIEGIFFRGEKWKLYCKARTLEEARRDLVSLLDTPYPISGRIRSVSGLRRKRELVVQFDDNRFYEVEPAEVEEFVTTGRCRRTGA